MEFEKRTKFRGRVVNAIPCMTMGDIGLAFELEVEGLDISVAWNGHPSSPLPRSGWFDFSAIPKSRETIDGKEWLIVRYVMLLGRARRQRRGDSA